jgi:GTP:adenosylcobinamide-phosphate guanylyltransferase
MLGRIDNLLDKKALLLVSKAKPETRELAEKYILPVFECSGKGYTVLGVFPY